MPHRHRGVMGGDGSESGPWDRSLYNAYMLIYQIVCFHFIPFLIANSIPVKLKIIKHPFQSQSCDCRAYIDPQRLQMWDRRGSKGQMKITENRDQGIPNKEQRLLEIFRVRFFFPFVEFGSLKVTTFLGNFLKKTVRYDCCFQSMPEHISPEAERCSHGLWFANRDQQGLLSAHGYHAKMNTNCND